jgi:hypothetical protein
VGGRQIKPLLDTVGPASAGCVAFTAIIVNIFVFWDVALCGPSKTGVSEECTASIFRTENSARGKPVSGRLSHHTMRHSSWTALVLHLTTLTGLLKENAASKASHIIN